MSAGGTGAAGYSTHLRTLVDVALAQDASARPTAAQIAARPYVAERLRAWAAASPAIVAAEAARRDEDARAHVSAAAGGTTTPTPGGAVAATAGSMFLSDFFDPYKAPGGLAGLEMRLNWNRLMQSCNRTFKWGGGQHWPRMAEHLLFTETRGPPTGFDLVEIAAGGEGDAGNEFFARLYCMALQTSVFPGRHGTAIGLDPHSRVLLCAALTGGEDKRGRCRGVGLWGGRAPRTWGRT